MSDCSCQMYISVGKIDNAGGNCRGIYFKDKFEEPHNAKPSYNRREDPKVEEMYLGY